MNKYEKIIIGCFVVSIIFVVLMIVGIVTNNSILASVSILLALLTYSISLPVRELANKGGNKDESTS